MESILRLSLSGGLMAKRNTFQDDRCPYHVVGRTVDRECFLASLQDVFNLFQIHLTYCSLIFNIRINGFVLMANHFHLLVTDPNGKIIPAIDYLIDQVEKTLKNLENRNKPVFFEKPIHIDQIKNRTHLQFVYKYLYRNPIEAKICSRAEQYPFSTLPFLLGKRNMTMTVFDNFNLIVNPHEKLKWINEPFSNLETDYLLENFDMKDFRTSSSFERSGAAP